MLKKTGELNCGSEAPQLPKADAKGNFPAVKYARTSLARKVIERRLKTGLTPAELAQRAKVSVQTVKGLESGIADVSVAAVDKIDAALVAAEKKARRKR